jgi:hypothetical protein
MKAIPEANGDDKGHYHNRSVRTAPALAAADTPGGPSVQRHVPCSVFAMLRRTVA